jgi:hypothetical protein
VDRRDDAIGFGGQKGIEGMEARDGFFLRPRTPCQLRHGPDAPWPGGAKQALSTDTQAPHPCPRGSFSISHRLSGASSPGDSSVAGRADRVALDVNARTGGPVIVPVADAHGERRVTQA